MRVNNLHMIVSEYLHKDSTPRNFSGRNVLRRPAVPGGVRQVEPRRLQEVQGEDRQGGAAPGRHGAVAHVRRETGTTPFNREHVLTRDKTTWFEMSCLEIR